ncbi:UDP-N-acetylmuramoyl-L-alanyl-D-glutamate--2,6-diaminopimelate ligase [Ectothiorhodospira mobilis]|uniref:UDP-N-acetylmuramoyl-L-alanyl-D-glutamate--2, 6-diaminopimelate ligase n=1 Tax=Ectothiorhodospira mobilis TaxID=195064 RepID=UPI001905D101|nr:UDP-N-acetylmuramoyl-L-alanyl-D-glutamate--2,6-diaminopimelate ligase [Ectothiorhodospira mobilis]MBK1692712.1 UDP-N-acetylmuramoyl-L-alanyl-D-glutamate--2,6-diaminopimelate ligase [Ectothiorhodospira mobilis]
MSRPPHPWSLARLLGPVAEVSSGAETDVQGLALDSRSVRPGDVFFALSGGHQHGLYHASQAVKRGAVAVAWEPMEGLMPPDAAVLGVPCVAVPGLRRHLGPIAARFHGHPSHHMQVVGVTGTDGKTSVSHFLAMALDALGPPCGLMGTLGNGRPGALVPTHRTTPDALVVQAGLASLREQGVRRVVLEVSSHALDQHRVDGVEFDVAILTHLGRDHLDYHLTPHAYGEAKARLFGWPNLKTAVLNLDDPFGALLAGRLDGRVPVLGYGRSPDPGGRDHLLARQVECLPRGLRFIVETPWGEGVLEAGILGRFNVYNLLAALGGLLSLDVGLADALERLGHVATVPGRMECFHATNGPTLVVDYAHTPGALVQALQAAREHCTGRLWCVFGCGGDRDRGKRPLMAAAAQDHADRVILTSDNPRHEDPMAILREVCTGFADPDAVIVEPDREVAIRRAFQAAAPGDLVLVAGKGHETGQIIGDQCRPHSDRQLAAVLTGQEGAP